MEMRIPKGVFTGAKTKTAKEDIRGKTLLQVMLAGRAVFLPYAPPLTQQCIALS